MNIMESFLRARRCVALVVATGMAACASGETRESIGEQREALWTTRQDGSGGLAYSKNADVNSASANAVVAISANASTGAGGRYAVPDDRCTGVLVGARHVVTSSRCARTQFSRGMPTVYFGANASGVDAPGAPIGASKVTYAPAPIDLAVLVLASDAPSTIVPASIAAALPQASLGAGDDRGCYSFGETDGVKAVGWSPRDGAENVTEEFKTQRHALLLKGGDVCRTSETGTSARGRWLRSRFFPGGAPRDGLSTGDEGGPLFVRAGADGSWSLVGIASEPRASLQGRPDCVDEDGSSRCDAWVDLLDPETRRWLQQFKMGLHAAASETCARSLTGEFTCWGASPALSAGPRTPSCGRLVGVLGEPAELVGGLTDSCAVTYGGALYCWTRGYGGSGNPPARRYVYQPFSKVVLGADTGCAVLAGGGLQCWGSPMTSWVPEAPVSGVVEDAALGSMHLCHVNGGRVFCQGDDSLGQRGGSSVDVPIKDLTNVRRLAAGAFHTCALQANGGVYCWGDNNQRQLGSASGGPVPSLANVVDLDAGAFHVCALQRSGAVRCWGDNAQGQTGGSSPTEDVPGVRDAIAIRAGEFHSCALIADGTVHCWGANGDGQTRAPNAATSVSFEGCN